MYQRGLQADRDDIGMGNATGHIPWAPARQAEAGILHGEPARRSPSK